jgi:streptogramin lyase
VRWRLVLVRRRHWQDVPPSPQGGRQSITVESDPAGAVVDQQTGADMRYAPSVMLWLALRAPEESAKLR